jgi:hypothetical protein
MSKPNERQPHHSTITIKEGMILMLMLIEKEPENRKINAQPLH